MDSYLPADFDLAKPPRPVGPTLTVRVMFGGVMSQLGWIFLGFGLIFVALFQPGAGMAAAVHFSRDLATGNGTVTDWRKLNLSINDTPVYETSYEFEPGDGSRYAGASYQTGRHRNQGDAVAIEYRANDPTISRIQGMRSTPGGLGVSFVYLFPFIGLCFVLFSIHRGLRARSLLANGRLGRGTLKSKEPTNATVNNQRVYKLTFEFEAEDGMTYEAVAKSHVPARLEDEAQERLVYDPRRPSDAVMLDELPARPKITRDGHFTVDGVGQIVVASLNLVAPGLTLLGHGAYYLLTR